MTNDTTNDVIYDYVVVDSKLLAYNCFHRKQPAIHMLKVLSTALSVNKIRFKKVLYAADWNKSAFRLRLQPDYKGHRDKQKAKMSSDKQKAQKEFIKAYNNLYNIFDYVGSNVQHIDAQTEADDTMMLVRYLRPDSNILLVSLDEDWYYQIHNTGTNKGNTHLLKYSQNKLIKTEQEVEELFGLPFDLLLDYSALAGQRKDNIFGVKQLGKSRFKKLLMDLPREEWWGVLEDLISTRKYGMELHPNAKEKTVFQQYHHNLIMMSPMPLEAFDRKDIEYCDNQLDKQPIELPYDEFIYKCVEELDTFPTIDLKDYTLLSKGNVNN